MYFILEKNILLKKWQGGCGYYLYRDSNRRYPAEDDEYELLRQCDGNTDIRQCFLTKKLEAARMIHPVEKAAEKLLPDQIKEYPNYYVKNIDWNITDICNCNCLHCFHAADIHTTGRAFFTYDECLQFLDGMVECGLTGVRLTGGEPTMHPQFREILQAIRERGLWLNTLITNGLNLNEELLDYINGIFPGTQIMISFDGLGTHDWLRQHKGAEEKTLQVIRLCKEAGFNVMINSNLNRKNAGCMFDSVKLLDGMGVDVIRIIRTTEVPRWAENAGGMSLPLDEYYRFSADFAKMYKEGGINAPVMIWQSMYLNGKRKTWTCYAAKAGNCNYDEDAPACSAMYQKPAVLANGDIIPCAPLAGPYGNAGIRMDNVKEAGLQKAMTGGVFVDALTHTAGEKLRENKKCGSCRWAKNCQGGCPAMSFVFDGSLLGSDPTKCIFFNNGWYEKYAAVMDGWRNLNPL